MAHKTITKDGVTYTFHNRYMLRVESRLTEFHMAKASVPVLAQNKILEGTWLIMAELMSVTAGVEGDDEIKALWAENHARPPLDIWNAIQDIDYRDDHSPLITWWNAYQAIQAPEQTTEETDFLDEKPGISPTPSQKQKPGKSLKQ